MRPTRQRRSQGVGTIYVITNPAWPGYSKIGRSFHPEERLRGYNIGSPLRDYEMQYLRVFKDVLKAERDLKQGLQGFHLWGEWYFLHPDHAATFIKELGDT